MKKTLKIDGKKLEELENVHPVKLSTDNNYIYFCEYEPADMITRAESLYHGVVYKMNVKTKEKETFFDFKKDTLIVFDLNSKYLLYSLRDGEVGVIDLQTKKRIEIFKLEMIDASTPSSIVYIDENEALIDPNDVKKLTEKNDRMIKINLKDLSYKEEY